MSERPAFKGGIWPQMPFMRGPKAAERMRQLNADLAIVSQAATTRRTRVLAHPWAAKRLCLIFGYSRPEQWSGYVPPATTAEGDHNDSPLRAALLELLREVAAHEAGGDADGAK